jgi:hypothetical protein
MASSGLGRSESWSSSAHSKNFSVTSHITARPEPRRRPTARTSPAFSKPSTMSRASLTPRMASICWTVTGWCMAMAIRVAPAASVNLRSFDDASGSRSVRVRMVQPSGPHRTRMPRPSQKAATRRKAP